MKSKLFNMNCNPSLVANVIATAISQEAFKERAKAVVSLEAYKHLKVDTKIRSHYRSAIMEGTIVGIMHAGTSAASTIYEIRPNRASHHNGEPATVHRHGDKVTVIQAFKKTKPATESFLPNLPMPLFPAEFERHFTLSLEAGGVGEFSKTLVAKMKEFIAKLIEWIKEKGRQIKTFLLAKMSQINYWSFDKDLPIPFVLNVYSGMVDKRSRSKINVLATNSILRYISEDHHGIDTTVMTRFRQDQSKIIQTLENIIHSKGKGIKLDIPDKPVFLARQYETQIGEIKENAEEYFTGEKVRITIDWAPERDDIKKNQLSIRKVFEKTIPSIISELESTTETLKTLSKNFDQLSGFESISQEERTYQLFSFYVRELQKLVSFIYQFIDLEMTVLLKMQKVLTPVNGSEKPVVESYTDIIGLAVATESYQKKNVVSTELFGNLFKSKKTSSKPKEEDGSRAGMDAYYEEKWTNRQNLEKFNRLFDSSGKPRAQYTLKESVEIPTRYLDIFYNDHNNPPKSLKEAFDNAQKLFQKEERNFEFLKGKNKPFNDTLLKLEKEINSVNLKTATADELEAIVRKYVNNRSLDKTLKELAPHDFNEALADNAKDIEAKSLTLSIDSSVFNKISHLGSLAYMSAKGARDYVDEMAIGFDYADPPFRAFSSEIWKTANPVTELLKKLDTEKVMESSHNALESVYYNLDLISEALIYLAVNSTDD